jgi:pimeloyl-ACP methyl ester carboxylesterase
MKRQFVLLFRGLLAALFMGLSLYSAHADPVVTRKSVQIYGQTISYLEAGSGPTLLLLHGLGSSGEQTWGAVIPELARHYHVVAPDQLGFGHSSKPLIGYGDQTWVDMIPPFLNALHITHFGLAGSSLGGWIATTYVLEAAKDGRMLMPDLLILADPGGHKLPPFSNNKFFSSTLSLASTRAAMSMVFHDQSMITDEAVMRRFEAKLRAGDAYTIDSFWKNLDASSDLFVDGKLGAIPIPTLIVWGENDRTIPIVYSREYASEIKGAKLIVIPACGHVPPAEKPVEFANAVEAFLTEHPLQGKP